MLEGIFSWALSRSLVPMPFIGSLPSRASSPWLAPGALASLGAFQGAGQPRQADLLVVIGQVSQKAAPLLQRLHARMADPAFVLHIRPTTEIGRSYASVEDLAPIIPIDVVIRADTPDDDDVKAGLERLRVAVRKRRT